MTNFDVSLIVPGVHRRFGKYLFDGILKEFPTARVFRDEYSIFPGKNIVSACVWAMNHSDYAVVVVGPGMLNPENEPDYEKNSDEMIEGVARNKSDGHKKESFAREELRIFKEKHSDWGKRVIFVLMGYQRTDSRINMLWKGVENPILVDTKREPKQARSSLRADRVAAVIAVLQNFSSFVPKILGVGLIERAPPKHTFFVFDDDGKEHAEKLKKDFLGSLRSLEKIEPNETNRIVIILVGEYKKNEDFFPVIQHYFENQKGFHSIVPIFFSPLDKIPRRSSAYHMTQLLGIQVGRKGKKTQMWNYSLVSNCMKEGISPSQLNLKESKRRNAFLQN